MNVDNTLIGGLDLATSPSDLMKRWRYLNCPYMREVEGLKSWELRHSTSRQAVSFYFERRIATECMLTRNIDVPVRTLFEWSVTERNWASRLYLALEIFLYP